MPVNNLIAVPKYFFYPDIIEKRAPLSDTTRRAGWTGCNILLNKISIQLGEKMIYLYDAYTDTGGRSNNEDAYLVEQRDDCYLFAVADGLGGHDKGEIASQLVICELRRRFLDSPQHFNISEAILAANDLIIQNQNKIGIKMRSTVAAAYITPIDVTLAYIGDTRIYIFRNDSIIYQSIDHSASQLAVFSGEIKPEDIRTHTDRNILTRALGVDENIKVEQRKFDNHMFTSMLLCSDGFWEYVTEENMSNCMRNSVMPRDWLLGTRKILADNAPDDNDNNTAVIIMKK